MQVSDIDPSLTQTEYLCPKCIWYNIWFVTSLSTPITSFQKQQHNLHFIQYSKGKQ